MQSPSPKIQSFVESKRASWESFDQVLERARRSGLARFEPHELRDFILEYRRLASDLAYAQSHFPRSRVTEYLNRLVARGYGLVYRGEGRSVRLLLGFFVTDFPRAFRGALPYFCFSTGLFLLLAALGFTICLVEPRLMSVMLNPAMVESVRAGRLWTESIFSVDPGGLISTFILTNNISVTFTTFAAGITFGVGTAYVLVVNGMMLGSAAALCYQYDLSLPFWSFVAPHGVIELSVIFVAGAAGLMLGTALIDPGDYTRRDALSRHGREAVKLILGGIPLLVIAGVVEGFISPSDVLSPWGKIGFGCTLGALMYAYLLFGGRSSSPRSAADGQ